MKQRSTSTNKGFSLIELIIVITIMAILTAVLAPQLLRYVEQSRVAKDESNIESLHHSIQLALTNENVYKLIRFRAPGFADLSTTSRVIYGTPQSGDNPGRVRVRHADFSPLPPGENQSGNFALAKELGTLFGRNYSAGSAWFPAEPFVSKEYSDKNVIFYIYRDTDGTVSIIKDIKLISETP